MVRELARYKGVDLWLEDSGWLLLAGDFKFEGGGLGFGYQMDTEFLKGFMGVWGVEFLSEVDDKPCWVTHDDERITLVEPLFPDEGTPFDVEAWRVARSKKEIKNA